MSFSRCWIRWGGAAAVAAIAAAGCNDAPDDEMPDVDAPAEMPFDEDEAGDVQGVVLYEGDPPEPDPLDMASEPDCQAHWEEQGITPHRDLVRLSEDGELSNVFIYVREGLEGMEFPIPGEASLIDQVGCRFTPSVASVQAGQQMVFRNSDGLLHNINATPQDNRPFNISQPVNMDSERVFAQPEVMIPIRCDVHGWMRGYVGVVSHPYHAVSADDGGFDLSTLPPGDYVIEAWHSELGVLEESVTVETGEVAEVTFTFEEGMLATANPPMADPIDPHDHHHPLDVRAMRNGAHGDHDHHAGPVARH